jgi:hypothetical protein
MIRRNRWRYARERESIVMRWLTMALLTLGLGACTTVGIEKDADGQGYALLVPSDVFASHASLSRYAAEKSGDLCPSGWTLVSEDSSSPDVHWRIRCLQRPAGIANQ